MTTHENLYEILEDLQEDLDKPLVHYNTLAIIEAIVIGASAFQRSGETAYGNT